MIVIRDAEVVLATTMAIDRTVMVYLLDDLEQRELVEWVRSPQDRRAFLIHLTPGGRDAHRRAATALDGTAETCWPRSTRPSAVT